MRWLATASGPKTRARLVRLQEGLGPLASGYSRARLVSPPAWASLRRGTFIEATAW